MSPQYRGDVVVAGEHLTGHLGIARLIGADQTEPVAPEDRNQAIEEEKGGQAEQRCRFSNLADRGKSGSKACNDARTLYVLAGADGPRLLGRLAHSYRWRCAGMAGSSAGTRFSFR